MMSLIYSVADRVRNTTTLHADVANIACHMHDCDRSFVVAIVYIIYIYII